jgi:cyclase
MKAGTRKEPARPRAAAVAALAVLGWASVVAAQPPQGRGAPAGSQAPQARGRANQPAAAEIHVLEVRPNVYMLSGAGGNITVLTFEQGVVVVDTGAAPMADRVLEAIRQISPKPIVDIINTSAAADHVGGNDKLAASGRRIPLEIVAGEGPMIIAHENVLTRMSAPTGSQAAAPERAWPNETYHRDTMKLSTHFHGGEAIELVYAPAASGDGDSLVWLRHADVIATGDIYTTTGYPMIDVAHGGTVNGEIAALNVVLDLAFPDYRSEGGTMIVPGHGRLSDMADVGYYRDMVTIVRDRVQNLLKKGMSLDQVKAAGPTRDYDPRFGATTGPWTTDMFVEAVYKSLAPARK